MIVRDVKTSRAPSCSDHARGASPVADRVYGAALAALATALFFISCTAPPLAEPHLPWWAIAIAWAVAEPCVVHLHFRRSAHSFSLADFPFVFGLAFASGDGFLLGALLGAGAAYAFRGCRRSSSRSTSRSSRWRSASRS